MIELMKAWKSVKSVVLASNTKVFLHLRLMATVVSNLKAPFFFLQVTDLVGKCGRHLTDELLPDSL